VKFSKCLFFLPLTELLIQKFCCGVALSTDMRVIRSLGKIS
jgi:hypothetical protein